MIRLDCNTDPTFADLRHEGDTFTLISYAPRNSTPFYLARNARFLEIRDWIEAHANHAPEGERRFFRVFRHIDNGSQTFVCAYVVEGGKGGLGVDIWDRVSFPASFK